uniref:Uncharacterized protein n=1 Tax=Aegilops tauschii subsp. strangulata TaxID=200361 RepID=A0A452YBG3_AEGTS
MRRFQESVKALEADIEHANALASEFMRDYDGSVIQMRMAYSAVAHVLVQWTDCRLASALGLLKIMIYKVYAEDGTTTLPSWEREASIREFYGTFLNCYYLSIQAKPWKQQSPAVSLDRKKNMDDSTCSSIVFASRQVLYSRRCFSCQAGSLNWTTGSKGGCAWTSSREGMAISLSWIWRGRSSVGFVSR